MRIVILISLLLLPLAGFCQPKIWTLDECVTYAKEHNIDIKKVKIGAETAEVTLSESKWAYAPNISASNSYNISQGRVLDPTTYQFVNDNVVQGNNTSLSAGVTLFNGMRKMHNLKKSELSLQSQLLGVEKAENDLMLNITAYYLEILLAEESITNLKQVVATLTTQEHITKIKVDARKVTTADLFQIQAQLADANTAVLTAQNQLYIAKLNLCQLLEIEDYMSFQTVAPSDIDAVAGVVADSTYCSVDSVLRSAERLPELGVARLGIDVAKRDLSIARADYYPNVSLSAAYGSSFSDARQKSFVNPDGTYRYEAYPFFDQYRDNANSYVSVGINIPIFGGLATRKNVKRQSLAVKDAEYSLKVAEKQVAKKVNQAYIDQAIALEKCHSTKMYLISATEAAHQVDKKYNLGSATIVDYNTSIKNQVDAESKFLQAKYEYLFKTRIIRFYLSYTNNLDIQ